MIKHRDFNNWADQGSNIFIPALFLIQAYRAVFSRVKPKPKLLHRPMRRKENTFKSQWELKIKKKKQTA